MLLEADKIYQGTSQINLGTGPGRPWCRYATAVLVAQILISLQYNKAKLTMHASM